MNGDLLVWNEVLQRALEISSMGIRVDKAAMLKQLELAGKEERTKLYFHQRLLKRHTPSDHWRRYRTITFVYALSEEGTYRRNPGQHLAGRHA